MQWSPKTFHRGSCLDTGRQGSKRRGDEESSRPHKRIKLDDSELGKEADVVNLTKPTLGLVMDGWWFAKQYWDSMNGTIIGINYWGISMGHFNQPRWDNDGYES